MLTIGVAVVVSQGDYCFGGERVCRHAVGIRSECGGDGDGLLYLLLMLLYLLLNLLLLLLLLLLLKKLKLLLLAYGKCVARGRDHFVVVGDGLSVGVLFELFQGVLQRLTLIAEPDADDFAVVVELVGEHGHVGALISVCFWIGKLNCRIDSEIF